MPKTYKNSYGDKVPWTELNEGEQEFWTEFQNPKSDVHKTGITVAEYARNWELDNAVDWDEEDDS